MSDDVILQPDDGYISFDLIMARAAERCRGDDDQQPTDPESDDEVEDHGQIRF